MNWSSTVSNTKLLEYVSCVPPGTPVCVNTRPTKVLDVVKPDGPFSPLGASVKLMVSLTIW